MGLETAPKESSAMQITPRIVIILHSTEVALLLQAKLLEARGEVSSNISEERSEICSIHCG